MAIQDEMYKLIEAEINDTIEQGKEKRNLNIIKVKEVGKMLTALSMDKNEPENLVNQYIANIKNICND